MGAGVCKGAFSDQGSFARLLFNSFSTKTAQWCMYTLIARLNVPVFELKWPLFFERELDPDHVFQVWLDKTNTFIRLIDREHQTDRMQPVHGIRCAFADRAAEGQPPYSFTLVSSTCFETDQAFRDAIDASLDRDINNDKEKF